MTVSMLIAGTAPALSLSYRGSEVRAFALTSAQDRRPDGRARNPVCGWCETPVADGKADPGCYTTAITDLGVLPREPL
jgi:hypothetical protein